MALAAGPRTTPAHGYTTWAKVAVALTPVSWVAAALAGVAVGGGADDRGVLAAFGAFCVNALALAAPTAAVDLAVAGIRLGEEQARRVRVVAVILLVLTLVLVPWLVTSFSVTWLIAAFASGLVLWVEWWQADPDTPGG